MKKNAFLLAIAAVFFTFMSCGSSKVPQASKTEQDNPYGKEVFKTKSELLTEAGKGVRAYGKGVSFSESAARELAEMDARAQFSRSIATAIETATKRVGFDITKYAGGNNEGMSATDGGERQNYLTKAISSNIVTNTSVINTDKFYGKDRKYTIFVCLEYNGTLEEMANKSAEIVKQLVSDEDRAKIDQNNDDFEREFEKNKSGN